MTAKTTIALNDSALTPESPGTPAAGTRTFTPGEMENGNVHTFYETTTGVTAATRSKMTLSLVPSETVTRFKLSIATPKAQTVDGIVKAAHVTRGFMEFILPNDGTRDDRRDIRSLLTYINNDAGFKAMVDDLENLW